MKNIVESLTGNYLFGTFTLLFFLSCSNNDINQLNNGHHVKTTWQLRLNTLKIFSFSLKNDIPYIDNNFIDETLKKYQTDKPQHNNISVNQLLVKQLEIRSGGVKLLKFKRINDLTDYKLLCEQKQIPFFHDQDYVKAYVSESYFSERQKFNCFIASKTKNIHQQLIAKFQVKRTGFRLERLRFKKRKVILNPKDLKRAIQEKELLKRIYGFSNSKPYFHSAFALPLTSKITSHYGTIRVYNNIKRTQHLGVDFRAKTGTPIPASNRAKVALAQNLFFSGNTVILDHGVGIYTMYAHLSKILVKKDQTVFQDQIIGLAGSTGRARGPHLHWGVRVHNEWINGIWLTQEGY